VCSKSTKKLFGPGGLIWKGCPKILPDEESEKKGGRLPNASKTDEPYEDHFFEIICCHTAGDPMIEDQCWTYLTGAEIARQMTEMGTPICADTARTMLAEAGMGQRKIEKTKTMGDVEHRNEQFENIAQLRRDFKRAELPVLSIDGKKKEFLGELFRPGRCYGNAALVAFDHDFPSYATGKIIPHGIYDVVRNVGHMTLGTSSETSEFATDSVYLWWQRHGVRHYAGAESMLILCDSGGSNNARHHIFKYDLQRLADRMGVEIRIAHYPPHCSKYNPIEHRYFCHVTRAWSGLLFKSMKIVIDGLRRVWTSTGLRSTYAIVDHVYQLQRKASDEFLYECPILFDNFLPEWNYVATPSGSS
jgi:hypothetical protein